MINPDRSGDTLPHSVPGTSGEVEDALADLVSKLTGLGYSSSLVHETLGPKGESAVRAGNPGAAAWVLDNDCSSLPEHRILTSAIYLRRPHPIEDLHRLFDQESVATFISLGIFQPVRRDLHEIADPASAKELSRYVLMIDVRPVAVPSHTECEVLVASDADASSYAFVPGPNHVPGVGHAPLSLLNVIPSLTPEPMDVLDLGCGSGVLSLVLAAANPQAKIVATDIHDRALMFARASAQSLPDDAGTIDWREGNWFEPVEGQKFDLIVSNPPFVMGPAEVGHVYRDSGLELDGASALVVSESARFLREGGRAHLLAGWAVTPDTSRESKLSRWLPSHDINGWAVQRSEVDVPTYVTTWLTDESIDPRSPEGRTKSSSWLDFFAAHKVTSIGLGWVHLERREGPTELLVESLEHPLSSGTFLGADVAEYFQRHDWLSSCLLYTSPSPRD